MNFFTGLHQPSDARHFDASFISVNRLVGRRSKFPVRNWIMDCGGFTAISSGKGHMPAVKYAEEIRRWAACGNLLAAVSQDWMCEPWILKVTGLTILDHQLLTIERYDELRELTAGSGVHIMPVLQGYDPVDYVEHIRLYANRLTPGMWVGVGSVCKRNGNISAIRNVLMAIKSVRPDLKLHGFGLKTTALSDSLIRDYLETADSMAWSFAARKQGRNANNYREALSFTSNVQKEPAQGALRFQASLKSELREEQP